MIYKMIWLLLLLKSIDEFNYLFCIKNDVCVFSAEITKIQVFFRISGKTGSRIRIFFGLKPPCDQDGANKKKFSQIGPAVPELLRDRQTNRHTDRQKPLLLCSIDILTLEIFDQYLILDHHNIKKYITWNNNQS